MRESVLRVTSRNAIREWFIGWVSGSARKSAENIRLKIGERFRFCCAKEETSFHTEYPAGSLPCGSYWSKERPFHTGTPLRMREQGALLRLI